MTKNRFDLAAGQMKSGRKLRQELRTKANKLIDSLSNLVDEFNRLVEQAKKIPGTVYWEQEHPEQNPYIERIGDTSYKSDMGASKFDVNKIKHSKRVI